MPHHRSLIYSPMSLPTIRTSRLVLRPVTTGDLNALFRIFSDPELTRYWGHPPLSDREAAEALLEEIEAGALSGKLMQWGITHGRMHPLIGTCTLADLDRQHRRADLGVALAREHQSQGFAIEAARAVIRHGFEGLQLHRITADVDPRNAPALKLIGRLGFRKEGQLREHYWQHDEWQDGVLFGLLKREWKRTAA